MATTSPDNIWTPDSGDDYALTVDLAAMADTVQDALTARPVNYRVLTNAQRLALTGPALFEGLTVWTSDTKIEWLYTGGAWVDQTRGLTVVRPASVVGGTVQADGSVNFNAMTVSLNGVFTSRFREYQVHYRTSAKTIADGISLRLRASGTDSNSNYFYRRIGSAGGGPIEFGTTTGTAFEQDFQGYPVIIKTLNLIQPQSAAFTTVWSAGGVEVNNALGLQNMISFAGQHQLANAYDGFTLSMTAGAMTGNVIVFGMN